MPTGSSVVQLFAKLHLRSMASFGVPRQDQMTQTCTRTLPGASARMVFSKWHSRTVYFQSIYNP